MAHPVMFSEDDPGLAELRAICHALPGVEEFLSHGRPNFRAGKIFAVYGGSEKLRPGVHEPHPFALLFRPDEAERIALEQDDRFFVPAYLGPYGWLGVDLAGDGVDWREVGELVDASYRILAPKRLVAELDAR